jgi:DNA-binding beta-propeller fold protein YncE
MKPNAYALLACVVSGAALLAAQETEQPLAEAGEYRVLKKEVIGGDGSWDLLTIDPAARQLYISRETRVLVLDMDTCKVVKEIAGTNGVHGVAVAPEQNRAFITNGRDNTVTVLDLKTLEKVGEAKSGPKPDAIVFDGKSRRVFSFNNGGTTATAIDASTGKEVGSVELGGAPEFAVPDGKGRMYVNLEDKSEVVAFDTDKLEALSRWPLDPGKAPTGLALDSEHRRLFSGCRDTKTLVVLDADTGKVVTSLPIGSGEDAVVFDPATQTVFSSNGEGTLTVIHEDTPDNYRVVQTVATQAGARTMALDSKTHQIWLVAAETKPAPESEKNRRRRVVVPDTFTVLVVGRN